MLQALLAGVASIKAQQTRMNVIGNNLANTNTTAYKGSRVTFQDMLSQTISGASRPGTGVGGKNPIQVGLGVTVAGTSVNSTQGSLNATNRPSDLAIQGEGFFAVTDGIDLSYTRDGAFDLDADGNLIHDATGHRLLGWTADASGNIDNTKPVTAASFLAIPVGTQKAAQQTSQVNLAGNFDSRATNTTTWTTTVKIYDSVGGPQDLTITFNNHQNYTSSTAPSGAPTAVGSWDWTAKVGTTTVGSSATTGNSPIYFDATGKVVGTVQKGVVAIPGVGGTTFNVNVNYGKLNQLATETSVAASDQDGFAAGSLTSYAIGEDGIISGQFSNGLNRKLGQIALVNFANAAGLERKGSNLWQTSSNSGAAIFGSPQSQGRGSLNAGFLEQSNVDISGEFTDLIVTQRGFQANTKVITTVDEMMQDLLNIKR